MKHIKTIFISLSVLSLLDASSQAMAQEVEPLKESKTSEPIENRLEIEKTKEQFKKQYIKYSVDPKESGRYLELISSNRELLQIVQDRELRLKLNQQQIELVKQANALKQINTEGSSGQGLTRSNLDLTGFIPEKKPEEKKPMLQSISNGTIAMFRVDGKLEQASAGERLSSGELVQSISNGTVKLKTRTGTVTLRGMPLGD
tara:strand:+ start:322 stop:927 length:606 start_codon:yes stop_codon:yes gene_type:complete